jgi:hypothetical protein
MLQFPESRYSSALPAQNDFLFHYACIRLLEFSHDPTGQFRVSWSLG